MTRTLTRIAAGGLIGAAALLTLGTLLSGSGWLSTAYLRSGGSLCGPADGTSEQVSLPFASGDSLTIDLPGTVRYQPTDTPGAIATGAPSLLAHLRLDAGRLYLDCAPGNSPARLDISLSGPAIPRWQLRGDVNLDLSRIAQPALEVTLRGSGHATASGRVEAVTVHISGSGEAGLEGLTASSATVTVKGSGTARVTADSKADITLSGSGTVDLSGDPEILRQEIRGKGRIVQVR